MNSNLVAPCDAFHLGLAHLNQRDHNSQILCTNKHQLQTLQNVQNLQNLQSRPVAKFLCLSSSPAATLPLPGLPPPDENPTFINELWIEVTEYCASLFYLPSESYSQEEADADADAYALLLMANADNLLPMANAQTPGLGVFADPKYDTLLQAHGITMLVEDDCISGEQAVANINTPLEEQAAYNKPSRPPRSSTEAAWGSVDDPQKCKEGLEQAAGNSDAIARAIDDRIKSGASLFSMHEYLTRNVFLHGDQIPNKPFRRMEIHDLSTTAKKKYQLPPLITQLQPRASGPAVPERQNTKQASNPLVRPVRTAPQNPTTRSLPATKSYQSTSIRSASNATAALNARHLSFRPSISSRDNTKESPIPTHCSHVVRDLQLPCSGFDFSYWIEVQNLRNHSPSQIAQVTFVTQAQGSLNPRTTSPYLSFAFDDSFGKQVPNEDRENFLKHKIAVYGSTALFNRYQLYKSALKAMKKKKNKSYSTSTDPSTTSIALSHFGVTVLKEQVEIYIFRCKTFSSDDLFDVSSQNDVPWSGCTMTNIWGGSMADVACLKHLVDRLQTLHQWGTRIYVDGLTRDLVACLGGSNV